MRRLTAYWIDLVLVAGFFVLPFLLYGAVTLGSRTMIPADNLFQWAPWAAAAERLGTAVPHNSLLADLLIENLAWKRFAVASLRGGEIPLWNPYLFAGAPFLATGQHGMLYPFSWIFFLLSPEKAYGWYTVGQLWLAGSAMYLFGRVLGMRRAGAAFAGLVYQGSGFMLTSSAVFPMIIGAAAWLPFLLACIEQIVRKAGTPARSTMLWFGAGAVALGLQILAGHIEITYYTLLIMGLYALWRLAGLGLAARGAAAPWYTAVWQPALWLLGLAAVGVTLGAVQLVPFYEVGRLNFREGAASFAEVRGWAFPWRRAITLLLPNFFGNPAHHSYLDVFGAGRVPFTLNSFGELNPQGAYTSSWGIKNYVEGGIYLGILPLFLALLGAISGWRAGPGSRRRTLTLFFLVLGFFAVAFIFGTPLYALLYYGLPFINQLHTPFRWVWPLSLAVAALAGFGLDGMLNRQVRGAGGEGRAWPAGAAWAAGAAGTAVLLALLLSRLFYTSTEPLLTRLFEGMALANTAFADTRAFYSYLFWQLLLLGGALLGTAVVLWLGRRGRSRPLLILAAALLIGDLFLANRGFNAAVDPALLAYQPRLLGWLQEQPGLWRLTTFTPQGDKPLNANTPWLYDLQDVRGYDSIIPRQYTDYMAAIEPQNELPFNRVQPIGSWEALNSPLLDVLGVRYVISAAEISLPKLEEVWTGEGLRVYENLAVAPRAYLLPQGATQVVEDALAGLAQFDPRQYVVIAAADLPDEAQALAAAPGQAGRLAAASVAAYGGVEVVVEAETAVPAWLILNDSYFPGWKAYVRPWGGGEAAEMEVPISRVNGNFRGVLLEAGQWTVRFRYSPASFQLGGLLSAMGLIILLFITAVWGWRQLYKPQGQLSTTRSLAKNSALPMGLNLFNRLIDFLFAMFYLRLLGPADAGRYAAAIATAGIFEILANYGLDILLIRDVSQNKDRAGHYLFNTTILRLAAGALAALPVLIFLWGTQFTENPLSTAEVAAVLLIMLGMVFSGMSKGVTGLFYVNEEAEIPAAMTTATTIMKVGLGVVVLLLGYSFVGLAGVSIVVNIITLGALLVVALRRFGLQGPWQLDMGLQRDLARKGLPLMLIHLLQTVFISVDIILLRLMLVNGEEVVGWYQNAYKWFNALQIIPSFFTLALFPVISREIQRSPGAARRMYTLSLKLMLLLALPIAALTAFAATPLVRLLGGPQYLPHGAIALQIVIWSIPFGWLNSVTNYVLIALGLEGMQPRAFAIAVGFNIIANVLLIPRFSYVAAAVTTILSEIVLMAVFAFYLRQRMDGVSWVGLVARPWLAAGAMVLVMWGAGQVSLILALLLGPVAYLAGLFALKVIGADERQVLAAILPASLAGRLRLTA